jgi:hypothetical protein
MAKSSATSTKSVLNTKKEGKAKRKFGPKENKPKKYRGQGRKVLKK